MSRTLDTACFTTALGECALAWSALGLTGVWLPGTRVVALRMRHARQSGGREPAPPAEIAGVIDALSHALSGARVGLREVALDLTGIDDFRRRVYAVARTIALGRVLTYGALAERVGAGATARAVGQALGANPFPIIVPCHRVVATGGLGGFSAPGGAATKQRLLTLEDARLDGPADLFDTETFDTETRAGAASRT